jgi:citrate lyase subunit beta/citryl-CoA lyase
MLAKTETNSDVAKLSDMLNEAEKVSGLDPDSLEIVPLIESAKGVVNTYDIASADARVIAVAFGAGDYY